MKSNNISRRDFLKVAPAAVASAGLASAGLAAGSNATPASTESKAVLVDTRRCVNCKACQVACKTWNDNPTDTTKEKTDFSPITWTYVKEKEMGSIKEGNLKYVFAKDQCKHCVEPTCVSVCPTGAMYKRPDGPVLYDPTRCIGCEYCVAACPFHVPRFDKETKTIKKCVFCYARLDEGMEPACVGTCIGGALQFGSRDEILAKAHASGAKYIYGENEVGGLSWIYVSDVAFEDMGFPKLSSEPPSTFSAGMLTQITGVGVGLGAVAAIMYALKKRKGEVVDVPTKNKKKEVMKK